MTCLPHIQFASFCALLTIATSASADCAWVLWAGYSGNTTMSSGPSVQYFPSGGKPTYDGCVALRNEAQQTNDARHGQYAMFWSYVCLPDTVDPRGPRGK
jgi:hypothetical protein